MPEKQVPEADKAINTVRENTIPQLEARDMCKYYGDFAANDHVNLRLYGGEIQALLGENGAGKSTLVKMIAGMTRPDAGTLYWQGEPITLKNPKVAKKLGIGMVFQHFSLFEQLTVLDNIALALPDKYEPRALSEKLLALSSHYGLSIDPDARVNTLSVGAKQRIEIIRALMQNPKLLILDEPTAVLTPQEADKLFVTLNTLAAEGRAILYISHRLDEIRRLCNTATVMRAGRVVDEIIPSQKSAKQIAELMLGEQILTPRQDNVLPDEHVMLQVSHASLAANPQTGQRALTDINLTLHRGEIFAIAGIAGNGQNELMAMLSGEIKLADANKILLDGEPIAHRGITARREKGLGVSYVPEERLGHGAVAEMRLVDNVLLTTNKAGKLVNYGLIDYGKACEETNKIIGDFRVKARGVDALAGELSGGNLQKFIVGREIRQAPKVILAAQPTWGVDAGAASQIQQTLIDLAKSGCAVLVISQDLDEVFAIAHRVAIMHEGRLSKPYASDAITLDEIGLLMVGESLPEKATDKVAVKVTDTDIDPSQYQDFKHLASFYQSAKTLASGQADAQTLKTMTQQANQIVGAGIQPAAGLDLTVDADSAQGINSATQVNLQQAGDE